MFGGGKVGEDVLKRGKQGRSMVINEGGVVSCEHPLAAQIAVQVLDKGGNAVDAAIAANAAMGVVAPMKCGVGGDLFAIVYEAKTGQLHGLNASGWSSSALSPKILERDGLSSIPLNNIHSVTVPGAVDGWVKLSEKFGAVPLETCLESSAKLAERGFPVAEWVDIYWQEQLENLSQHEESSRVFLVDQDGKKRTPRAGECMKNPDLAHTYRVIAKEGVKGFYQGEIVEKIMNISDQLGGTLTKEDFAEFSSEWVEPLSTKYRDMTVYELPPNGQGIAALMMLNILENFDLKESGHNTGDSLHLMIEAKNMAYVDMMRHNADLLRAKVPVKEMVSKEYSATRAKEIDPKKTNDQPPPYPFPETSDTTYLSVVDKDGNMVSLIQSIYTSFGTAITPLGTGFCLQNRGNLFSLDPKHPNFLEGRKRPFHTIIPGFMERGNEKYAFGIMGGFNQAQAHAQFVSNIVDHKMNIQAAMEAPRFTKHNLTGPMVLLEDGMKKETYDSLCEKGHDVRVQTRYFAAMGGGQVTMRNFEKKMNYGASDPRKDGASVPQLLL